jgi:hypothetical protein
MLMLLSGSKKYYLFVCFILFSALILGGCGAGSAVHRTENYSYSWPNISYSTNGNLVVGVIDQRPYITSGKNEDTFVGLMRGGFGNPWHMHTESGKPLATDISQAVLSGYMNAGVNTVSVFLTPNMSQQDIANKLISAQSQRKILIKINEWKSDTYKNTKFLYDLSAEVYNENGEKIAEHGEENLSKKDDNKSAVDVVNAGREVLSRLLNNESIVRAM